MVDKSEKVVWMARLGFVARGIVYALLGYLALSSAESQTVKQGQSGALEYLNSIPGGSRSSPNPPRSRQGSASRRKRMPR